MMADAEFNCAEKFDIPYANMMYDVIRVLPRSMCILDQSTLTYAAPVSTIVRLYAFF